MAHKLKESFYEFRILYTWDFTRTLLGESITRSLLLWVLKKIFSFELTKNGICLGATPSFIKCPPQNAPTHQMARTDPVSTKIINHIEVFHVVRDTFTVISKSTC